MDPEETMISCFYYPMSQTFGWTPNEIDGMEIDVFMEYLVESMGRTNEKKGKYIDDIMGF